MRINAGFGVGYGRVLAALAAAAIVATPLGAGAAVEYVKICSLFGAGFNYVPGTDVCYNAATNDARQVTESGPWKWRMPNNPAQPVSAPKKACKGRLVSVGSFPSSSLVPNLFTLSTVDANLVTHVYPRFETSPRLPLALGQDEFISSVIFQGGYTGVGTGNFCLFYFHHDSVSGIDVYDALGCLDTASRAGQPQATAFAPDAPLPPNTTDPVFLVGANGTHWGVESFADVGGSLSISVCVQKALPPK